MSAKFTVNLQKYSNNLTSSYNQSNFYKFTGLPHPYDIDERLSNSTMNEYYRIFYNKFIGSAPKRYPDEPTKPAEMKLMIKVQDPEAKIVESNEINFTCSKSSFS